MREQLVGSASESPQLKGAPGGPPTASQRVCPHTAPRQVCHPPAAVLKDAPARQQRCRVTTSSFSLVDAARAASSSATVTSVLAEPRSWDSMNPRWLPSPRLPWPAAGWETRGGSVEASSGPAASPAGGTGAGAMAAPTHTLHKGPAKERPVCAGALSDRRIPHFAHFPKASAPLQSACCCGIASHT